MSSWMTDRPIMIKSFCCPHFIDVKYLKKILKWNCCRQVSCFWTDSKRETDLGDYQSSRQNHANFQGSSAILVFDVILVSDVQNYTVCQKKRHPVYFCDNLVRCRPIFPILSCNVPQEKETKHILRVHHIMLYMFALYLVKTSNDFAVYSIASNMKSPHISPVVTSDNY